MTNPVPLPPPGFDDLSVDEQIEYVQSLWNRIAASPEQVPCLSHSLKINPGAGIRSSIEVMILRSSRGAGRWQ